MRSPQMEEKHIVTLLLLLILLLATLLRLVGLASQNLGPDEIVMAEIAKPDRTIREVIHICLTNAPTPRPPLAYLINHLFLKISDTDFALRFSSVLFGVAAVAATYAIGKLLLGTRVGLVGAFLLSISVVHVRYSQVARYYPLLLLLSIVSLYCLYIGMIRGERKWWLALTLVNVLNLYNHYFACFVLVSEAAITGIYFILEVDSARRLHVTSSSRSPAHERWLLSIQRALKLVLPFFTSTLTALVLFLPILSSLVIGAGGARDGALTPPLSLVGSVVMEWVPEPGFSLWLAVVLFLAGLVALVRRGRRQLVVMALWLAVPFLALFTVPLTHKFYPRYFVFMLPVFLLTASRGLVEIVQVLSGLATRLFGKPGLSWVGTAGLLLLIAVPTGLTLNKYYGRAQSDWRGASHFLCDAVATGDVVVVRRASHQAVLSRYCRSIAEQPFALVGRPDAQLLRDLLRQGGVWIVGKETQNEAMSESETELRAASNLPVLRVVFRGSVASGVPGVGQRLLDDIWVLHARESLTAESMADLYRDAFAALPSDAEMSILNPAGGH